jgi:chromosome segregation ATPase
MLDLQTSLQGLQDKLQVLLKNYAGLEKENQQLKSKLAQTESAMAGLETDLKEQQSKLTAAMMHKASMDPAEKGKWVKQIDQYLKEIDHCINNLNS